MADNLVLQKLFDELIPIANSGSDKSDISTQFSSRIKEFFGLDRAVMNPVGSSTSSALSNYLINTKKPYIDNQLSEYSDFPELVSRHAEGYSSCAVVPVMANGRVTHLIELYSKIQGRFSQDIVDSVYIAAHLVGYAINYKSEASRNLSLVEYFNAAFDGSGMQVLAAPTNKVVKANARVRKEFPELNNSYSDVQKIFGIDFQEVEAAKRKAYSLSLEVMGKVRRYSAMATMVNKSLMHISVADITDTEMLSSVNRLIMNSGDVTVVSVNGELSVTAAADNFERIFGYTPQMLEGINIANLVKESDRARAKSSLEELLKSDSGSAVLYADIMPNSAIPIYSKIVAMRTEGGAMLLIEKADSEKYLAAVTDGLYGFLESTSDIAIISTDIGYIDSCNMPAESVLGYAKEDLIGKELRSVYEDEKILDRDLNYAKRYGKVDNSYVNVKRRDGVPVPATHSIRLFKKADGSVSYIILIKELLTKRTLDDLEMKLRNSQSEVAKLKGVGDLKSQFIYNISHELKTPLTNIEGFAKLIRNGEFGELSPEQKEYLSTIIDESSRLMLIIQQVLDAAKLESDKVKLDVREVNLRDMYNNPTIKSLEESAVNKGLEFKWNVDYDVPPIIADPNRLIQVFVNLIGNSIKFTDKGGITVHMFRKTRKSIEFDVIDTGIGISPEDKRRLFREFYQAPKKELVMQPGAGTGLGLSITREIVSLHHGKIKVDSELGKGSKFYFILPVAYKQRRAKAAAK